MLFKNLFLGLVGIAAVGGIGYGIYSSSQSNDEDKKGDESKDQVDDEGDTKSSVPKVENDVQEQENNTKRDNTNNNFSDTPGP